MVEDWTPTFVDTHIDEYVDAGDVRAKLREILKRLRDERFVTGIAYYGRVRAVLMSVDMYEELSRAAGLLDPATTEDVTQSENAPDDE